MFFKSFQFNSNDRKNIKQIKKIESEEVLKLHYAKSYTIFKGFQRLVPQELYDNENKNEYYKFNGVENIMTDQVVSQNLIVLYQLLVI